MTLTCYVCEMSATLSLLLYVQFMRFILMASALISELSTNASSALMITAWLKYDPMHTIYTVLS